MTLNYVNDNGCHATVVENKGVVKVYTDLSACEKHYNTIDDAKHDLSVNGFYQEN